MKKVYIWSIRERLLPQPFWPGNNRLSASSCSFLPHVLALALLTTPALQLSEDNSVETLDLEPNAFSRHTQSVQSTHGTVVTLELVVEVHEGQLENLELLACQ